MNEVEMSRQPTISCRNSLTRASDKTFTIPSNVPQIRHQWAAAASDHIDGNLHRSCCVAFIKVKRINLVFFFGKNYSHSTRHDADKFECVTVETVKRLSIHIIRMALNRLAAGRCHCLRCFA